MVNFMFILLCVLFIVLEHDEMNFYFIFGIVF